MNIAEGLLHEIGDLSVTVASGDKLQIRQFTVQERMSSLFVVMLVAVSENPNVDFDAVVGHEATFSIRSGGHERSWSGLCNRLQQIGSEESGASIYHLNIVPPLWLATQRRNHRMFQQQSEIDIVLDLLREWRIEPDKKLTAKYKKRKYRVQYGESDYTFMCRMLEDAGISFYFEQQGEKTKLVLADAPQSNEPRAKKLPFREGSGADTTDHVFGVVLGQEVKPGRLTLQDHDYRRPPSQKVLATVNAGGGALEQQLEQYHYEPGAFLFGTDRGEDTPHADDRGKTRTDEAEGKILAQKRLDANRGAARVCTFETNALDLSPGVVMSMLDHPRTDLGEGKKLLIIESTLSGHPGEVSHACEARSADFPYRPPIETPKPKVAGVESATVVGPKGEEIHTDEFGRVRVHFHWDRESKMDEKSSCWIHVSQPWGGSGYGGTNLPRIGQEVLVDFIGGDPDKPVIVGRLYTNLQKTPYKLPDNKTQSGWKSNSTGGSGGYNEFMFEDASGRELVRMQAEKDLHKLVKHDEEVTVGHDNSESVGNDESLSVGNNRSRMVGNDETVTIGSNQTLTVGASQTITVGAGQTETITGDRTLTLTGNLTETITGDSTLTQTGDQTVTLTGSRTVTQTGARSEVVIGDMSLLQIGSRTDVQAGSRTTLQLGGETEIRLGNELHAQMGTETQIRVGTSTHMQIGPQTETVYGPKKLDATVLTVDATTVATIKAVLLELIASGEVKVEGPAVNVKGAAVSVKGGVINVEASGNTTIKGSLVKLNC